MKNPLSTRSLAATATLALAGLGLAGTAQADDVYWSIGLSSPGVHLGFSNAAPVVVQPRIYSPPYVVYSDPYPVYRKPRPVYVDPRPIVYVQPAPVFVGPPRYVQRGWDRHDRDWGPRGRDGDDWNRGIRRHGGQRGHNRD